MTSFSINPDGDIFVGLFGGGVYRSTNDGEVWEEVNSGLSNTYTNTLILNKDGYMFAGTYGEGVFRSVNPMLGIKRIDDNPQSLLAIGQNYPNPFSAFSTVDLAISEESNISLKIYDILGREVSQLVNERLSPGKYQISINGQILPNGTYFYHLLADDISKMMKFTVHH